MKLEIVVSTDILGMFGNIRDIEKLYGKKIKKLELIAWNLTLDRHIREAEKEGYEISSIHGQLTSLDSFDPLFIKTYMLLVDLLLRPTSKLIDYGKHFDLLFHAANINANNLGKIIKNKNNLRQIWIENHYKKLEGLKHAIGVVNELNRAGVNTGLTFDLAHFIGPEGLVGNQFSFSGRDCL